MKIEPIVNEFNIYILHMLERNNLTASAASCLLGLKSKSYLGMVLNGKRNLTLEQTHQLGRIFNLSTDEFDFFFHLTLAAQATSKEAKKYHQRKIQETCGTRASQKDSIAESERILSKWFYPVLILHGLLEKNIDASALAKNLGITQEEVLQGLSDLKGQGLIEAGVDGKWKPIQTRLKVSKKNWNQVQMKFLKEHIARAGQIFDRAYGQNGKFYSQTLTIEKDSMERIWSEIRALYDRIADQSDAELPEKMIQLNVQLYSIM